MSNLQSTKSILAKLLAQENINVVHQSSLPTAAFDLASRTLYCPVWEVMDGALYDLLMGHEVGHAEFTPEEGWHNSIKPHSGVSKSVLNVVEDARIEKLIKRRYAGLVRQFSLAYGELHARDFFGVKKLKDLSVLNFADRINLRFKIGAYCIVPFSDEENVIVQRISDAETWDEVVELARIVTEMVKQDTSSVDSEQDLKREIMKQYFDQRKQDFFGPDQDQDQEEEEADQDEDEDSDWDSDASSEEDGDSDFGDDDSDADSDSDSDSEEGFGDDDVDAEYDDAGDEGSVEEIQAEDADGEVTSVTDTIFRAAEKTLAVSNIDYETFNLPQLNMEATVETIEHTLNVFDGYWNNCIPSARDHIISSNRSRFKKANESFIMLLVKQFLMKKNASAFARTQTARSGELDMNKIHTYKFSNDLFSKVAIVPKGQSHGLVLILDMSGSMHDMFAATVEQLLILAAFCKRINLPFDIYGFSNIVSQWDVKSQFMEDPNALRVDNFCMKHLLSSSSKPSTYFKAFDMLLAVAYEKKNRGYTVATKNCGFDFGATPLVGATLASRYLAEALKKKYKLDVVTVIQLTDGDATDGFTHQNISMNSLFVDARMKQRTKVVRIVDQKTKTSIDLHSNDNEHHVLCNLLRKATGIKQIGIYIGSKRTMSQKLRDRFSTYSEEKRASMKKSLNTFSFFEADAVGFDKYFYVAQDNMNVQNQDYQTNSIVTKSDVRKLATSFSNAQVSKKANRVYVTKFMEELV